MRDTFKNRLFRFVKALLFSVCILEMAYWGMKKEGFHIDEVYSYGLANSEYLPFMHFGTHDYDVKDWMKEYGAGESAADLIGNVIKDFGILKDNDFHVKESEIYQKYLIAQQSSADTYSSNWRSGRDYKDYLTADSHNRFNYASVYYNQRGDVHPPMFYILLHTVSSLFSGQFSKWFGLLLNGSLMILCLIVLYGLVEKYLWSEKLALAVCAAFGLSCGFVSAAMLIRMYALLTLVVLIDCRVHLRIQAMDYDLCKKNRWQLFAITILGYMTHYYFVLYAIGMAMVLGISLMTERKWKELFRYIRTLILAAVIGICLWPFGPKHVFSGYRGQEAFGRMKSGLYYMYSSVAGAKQIIGATMGGYAWFLLIPLTAVVWYAVKSILTRKAEKRFLQRTAMLTVPVLLYYMVVSQIIPMMTDRYFMCVFPFVILWVVGSLFYLCEEMAHLKIWRSEKAAKLTKLMIPAVGLGIGTLLLLCNNAISHQPGYIYPGGILTYEYENTDCMYILPTGTWNETSEFTPIFAQCDQVCVMYERDIDTLGAQYRPTGDQQLLIGIHYTFEKEEVLQHVLASMGLEQTHISEEFDLGVGHWYILQKN